MKPSLPAMQPSLDLQSPEQETPIPRVCVTAGGTGVGHAIARAFWNEGARVHIGESAPEVLVQVLADHPGMHGTVVDPGETAEVESLFAEATEWMGGVDVLVNCALIGGPKGAIEEIEIDEWDRTLRVNLSGMFRCVQHAVRAMRPQRSGVIINLASSSARTGLPGRSAFVASMGGILSFTQNLARELGPDNIRCNAVLPGLLDDEQGRRVVKVRARERRQSMEVAEAEFLSYVSMRSWIDASEVADTVLFLASERARHITGQVLGVCGNVEWEG